MSSKKWLPVGRVAGGQQRGGGLDCRPRNMFQTHIQRTESVLNAQPQGYLVVVPVCLDEVNLPSISINVVQY